MAQTEKSLEEKIKEFEDRFCPLSFYCRLRELGLKKEESLEISRHYENLVYRPAFERVRMNAEK